MKPAISVGGRTGTAHNPTADEWGTSRSRDTVCDRGTPRLQPWEDVRDGTDEPGLDRVPSRRDGSARRPGRVPRGRRAERRPRPYTYTPDGPRRPSRRTVRRWLRAPRRTSPRGPVGQSGPVERPDGERPPSGSSFSAKVPSHSVRSPKSHPFSYVIATGAAVGTRLVDLRRLERRLSRPRAGDNRPNDLPPAFRSRFGGRSVRPVRRGGSGTVPRRARRRVRGGR